MILNIAIIIFIILELSNIIIMYFNPDFKYGNSMATFVEWSNSKSDEKRHMYSKYLVNWVANCKLIFVFILVIILLIGNEEVKVYSVITMIVSIGMYYITLHPVIKKLDEMGEIRPKGYSRTLGLMIGGFVSMFLIALMFNFLL